MKIKDQTAKGEILTKIRNALTKQTPQPFPTVDSFDNVYQKSEEPLEIQFAQEFLKIQGNFIFCENNSEFIESIASLAEEKNWNHLFCWEPDLHELFIKYNFKKFRIGRDLEKADAGITFCEALVARTGSVLISSKLNSGRSLPIFPPIHITVAYTNQLVPDIKQGFDLLKSKYGDNLPSMINLSSGPSRTADIEKTLVLGAHGPKEVYVFLIDNPL